MCQLWMLLIVLFALSLLCCGENSEGDEEIEQPKCGMTSPFPLDLVVKTTEGQAKPGEFPWTIALISNETFIGGGSLIAPNIVLTAAHIVLNKSAQDIIVSAGEWEYGKALEQYPFEEANVVKIVSHEKFHYKTGTNNLALLFLDQEYMITYRINTICLPRKNWASNDSRCFVAGWGKNGFRDHYYPTVLKKVEMPIVPWYTCQDQLRKTRLGSRYVLPAGLICAGGEENIDSCTGDGGGALFCPMAEDPQRFEQIGIVNWGIGCKQKDVPGVYTYLPDFRQWIDQQIEANQFLNDIINE
ncbi:phenoloxidase-activating factor 2 [Drosophila ficusphila]|uniref:phenoloxidase-activating factor 2 n=1 Tax=Drosophila ficusphila TaxID=30025 RepID=UPI0007E7FE0B|nr:phenoloxidase-activating factor 2 [Drosophila ficusphila]